MPGLDRVSERSQAERTEHQEQRLQDLGKLLDREIPRLEETPQAREAMRLFEKWTMDRLRERPPEEVAGIIREVRQFLLQGEEVDQE